MKRYLAMVMVVPMLMVPKPVPAPGHVTKHNTYVHVYALAGDSIFATVYLPPQDRLITKLTGLLQGADVGDPNPSVVTDHAVGGQLLVGGPTSLSGMWPSILNSTPRPTTAIVKIGTNDLFGTTDLQFENAYLQLAAQSSAAGETILPCLITPLGQAKFSAREAQLERWNTWIINTFGKDFVVDLYTPLVTPGTHNLNPAYDSGDNMHPNAAGVAVMANTIFTNIH